MTRLERLALNELSKKAFGVSSKWKTLLDKGILSNGKTKYFTLEEITEIMNDRVSRAGKTVEEMVSDIQSAVAEVNSNEKNN
jgi:hypothetical protein